MLFVNEVGLYEVWSSQLEREAKAKRQKGKKKGSDESAGEEEEEEVEGGMPDEDTGDEEGQLSWWCGMWGYPAVSSRAGGVGGHPAVSS